VRFIMGTPMIVDVFHQDRWDYVYPFQEGGGNRVARRVSLYFTRDRLSRVDGNVTAAAGDIPRDPPREVTVDVPGVEQPGLVSRLKETVGLGTEQDAAQPAADALTETNEPQKKTVKVESTTEAEPSPQKSNESEDEVTPTASREAASEDDASTDAEVSEKDADEAANKASDPRLYDVMLEKVEPDEDEVPSDEEAEYEDIYEDPIQPDAPEPY
jgi:outer membrane protein assembly factor BamE (lipoprotein component of BamABCDE complex)